MRLSYVWCTGAQTLYSAKPVFLSQGLPPLHFFKENLGQRPKVSLHLQPLSLTSYKDGGLNHIERFFAVATALFFLKTDCHRHSMREKKEFLIRHENCRTSVSLVAVTKHNLLFLFLSRLPPFHYLLWCWLDLLSLPPSSLPHSCSELTNHWFSPWVQSCCHSVCML